MTLPRAQSIRLIPEYPEQGHASQQGVRSHREAERQVIESHFDDDVQEGLYGRCSEAMVRESLPPHVPDSPFFCRHHVASFCSPVARRESAVARSARFICLCRCTLLFQYRVRGVSETP